MEFNVQELKNLTKKQTVKEAQLIQFDGIRIVVMSDEYLLFTDLPRSTKETMIGTAPLGTVPSATFEKFLQKVKQETIDISSTNQELKIQVSKKAEAGIRLVPNQEIPSEPPEKGWKDLDPKWTEAALNASSCCAPKPDGGFSLTLVNCTANHVEAADQMHVIRIPVKNGIEAQLHNHSIKAIQEVTPTKWVDGEEWIWFKGEEGILGVRKFKTDSFPKLDRIFDKEGIPLMVPSKTILPALEKADVFSDGTLSLSLTKGKAEIKGEDETGWYKESIRIKYDGPDVSFKSPCVVLKEIIEKGTDWILTEVSVRIEFDGAIFVASLRKQ